MDEDVLTKMTDEQIYQVIGNAITNAISVGKWSTAELMARIEDEDNGQLSGRYRTTPTTDQWESFPTNLDMYLAIDELRDRMRRPEQAQWITAKFTLQYTGQFDLHFTYSDA